MPHKAIALTNKFLWHLTVNLHTINCQLGSEPKSSQSHSDGTVTVQWHRLLVTYGYGVQPY